MSPIALNQHAAYQLKERLLQVVSTVYSVERVMAFGSLAVDRCDAYSDVDWLVAVDQPDAAWQVVDAIRQDMPVLFYRKFSSDRQPAGRYWFKDQSPMTRLDVSFHSPDALDRIGDSELYLDHPVTCRLLYQRQASHRLDTSHNSIWASTKALTISSLETHLGQCLYRVSCAINRAMRGRTYRHGLEPCFADLVDAMAQTRNVAWAGGDGDALGRAYIALVSQLGLHHAAE